MTASSEESLVCLFILLAENGWYKGHTIELANDFTTGKSNYPKTVVAANRLLMNYIATSKSNHSKQEPDNAGVALSEVDGDNAWKKNVNCHSCGLKGHHLKECNMTSSEDKKKIYAMKMAGNFKAKKTGVVNTIVEDMSGNDASAASSVTINGSEHDQYQHFLVVCGEDTVELFNIGEGEEFAEDDAGFAIDFYTVGNVSLADVKDEWTLPSWMSVSDVTEVGEITFAENEWKKQG